MAMADMASEWLASITKTWVPYTFVMVWCPTFTFTFTPYTAKNHLGHQLAAPGFSRQFVYHCLELLSDPGAFERKINFCSMAVLNWSAVLNCLMVRGNKLFL